MLRRKQALVASSGFMAIYLIMKEAERKEKKRRQRRWWMTSLFESRRIYNASNLLDDLRREDSGHFNNLCRMPPPTFDVLLEMVTPFIQKQDTNFRQSIPPQERLALTLNFLATGNSFSSLAVTFKISKQLISEIVPEVCEAIIRVLRDEIKMPDTEEEWLKTAAEFDKQWQFPHCIGAIDGKHVQIIAPAASGSNFYNYKSTFSIVLMAVVDANYNFLYADVGCEGRISDGGVFRNSSLFKKMERNVLQLPSDNALRGRTKEVPFVFVADDAFPLKRNIMKPYAGHQVSGSKERAFNYRLSRARRIVENAFGIMSARFRVFRTSILLEPNKAATIVMACIHLHNFLRRNDASKNLYAPNGTFDAEVDGNVVEGSWRSMGAGENSNFHALRRVGRKSAKAAEEVRSEFADYFATNGKVSWQDEYA